MKLVWTEQALTRLGEIETYIAARSPVDAIKFVERLVGRGDSLQNFAHRGRRVPEFGSSEFRETREGNYRIVYRIRDETVEILTVFEGHRLFPEEDVPFHGH